MSLRCGPEKTRSEGERFCAPPTAVHLAAKPGLQLLWARLPPHLLHLSSVTACAIVLSSPHRHCWLQERDAIGSAVRQVRRPPVWQHPARDPREDFTWQTDECFLIYYFNVA